jgi:hypothetical protein
MATLNLMSVAASALAILYWAFELHRSQQEMKRLRERTVKFENAIHRRRDAIQNEIRTHKLMALPYDNEETHLSHDAKHYEDALRSLQARTRFEVALSGSPFARGDAERLLTLTSQVETSRHFIAHYQDTVAKDKVKLEKLEEELAECAKDLECAKSNSDSLPSP